MDACILPPSSQKSLLHLHLCVCIWFAEPKSHDCALEAKETEKCGSFFFYPEKVRFTPWGTIIMQKRVSKDLANRVNQNDLHFRSLQVLINVRSLPPDTMFAAIRWKWAQVPASGCLLQTAVISLLNASQGKRILTYEAHSTHQAPC